MRITFTFERSVGNITKLMQGEIDLEHDASVQIALMDDGDAVRINLLEVISGEPPVEETPA